MFRFASTFGAVLLSVASAAAQAPPPDMPVVVTQGEASVKRAPDVAWVSISAEGRAVKSADAQQRSAAAMTALQSALKGLGLPADAIKTTNFSLQQDMEYVSGSARPKGYVAVNQIEVRVEPLDKISGVLDAATGSGATTISGLRFDVKDRNAVEREALRLAVQDAMQRAQAMAAGASRTLGPIVRIEEQRTSLPVPRPMMMAARADAAAPTPITPGETEIRAQVVLTVALAR
jgi:uncharacterized protein YggE